MSYIVRMAEIFVSEVTVTEGIMYGSFDDETVF